MRWNSICRINKVVIVVPELFDQQAVLGDAGPVHFRLPLQPVDLPASISNSSGLNKNFCTSESYDCF